MLSVRKKKLRLLSRENIVWMNYIRETEHDSLSKSVVFGYFTGKKKKPIRLIFGEFRYRKNSLNSPDSWKCSKTKTWSSATGSWSTRYRRCRKWASGACGRRTWTRNRRRRPSAAAAVTRSPTTTTTAVATVGRRAVAKSRWSSIKTARNRSWKRWRCNIRTSGVVSVRRRHHRRAGVRAGRRIGCGTRTTPPPSPFSAGYRNEMIINKTKTKPFMLLL